ncbi:MAG: NADH-quinone oxidoreductase subunit NuoF [Ardenticatenaceae bacterium]|nr:NADH-quinone oxidoreductase subunit NuoF [Ardenticatenaceae bacterium]
MTHIILRHHDVENIHELSVYQANGGYEGLKKAFSLGPKAVIDEVKKAVVRGRGGAGFPAGLKWGFIPGGDMQKYIVINTDESETGTFKDREILEKNPHQVIEGALIAAYAVGATKIYNYWRGEYMDAAYACEKAIKDCYASGLLGENILGSGFSCDFYNHFGAGAYICGEETALLNSLMGDLGQPWSKPPFPAQEGLYGKPTVVNNVETLANIAPILVNGADWYVGLGTDQSNGIKVVCLSGHVNRPGNYEIEMGKVTYHQLIYGEEYGQGMRDDKGFKALLPSGGSGPVVTADALDADVSFEGLNPFGSMMGSASIIVMDEDTDMVWATEKMTHFFKHESCGKCTPCREGTFWLEKLLIKINKGRGTQEDIQKLERVATQIQGKCLCALGEFATSPVLSTIKHFMDEYKAKVNTAVPVPAD